MATKQTPRGKVTSDKQRTAGSGRYTVAAGTQVHHDGTLHSAGETFEAAAEAAVEWLARGYVTEAPADETLR